MIITIYNRKKENVGYIDTDDKTYYTQRDNSKNQVFRHFGNGVACDVSILKQLIQHNVIFIFVLITNFEPKSFYLVSSVQHFLEHSERINYDKKNQYGENYTGYGKQRRMPMTLWSKAYSIADAKALRYKDLTYIL